MKNKLIVILGPTASGKTDLSIRLALRLRSGRNNFGINGAEIISADSRQVYKGMDIGSGKITKKEMQGVPHHLLDVANPKTRFTVAQYQKLALGAIKGIQKRKNIPFLIGGSPFYINSVVQNTTIPEVKPNWKLRQKLALKPLSELVKQLAKLDPVRASNIDQNNPRRVIRALEIVLSTKKPVPELESQTSQFHTLFIGIKKSPAELKTAIHKRLLQRLEKNALVNEVKKLRKNISWKRLEEFGLEYKFVAQYLQNKIAFDEMINKIETDSWHLVKKQMTWFKPNNRIHWVKNYKQAEKLVKKFLAK